MAAIYFQFPDIIANLLDHHVDVEKRDGIGNTALMWAIEVHDTNTVILLVQEYPKALREGEDWSKVAAETRVDAYSMDWNTLLGQFLTNNPEISTNH
jgi:ankyrin repeat protein